MSEKLSQRDAAIVKTDNAIVKTDNNSEERESLGSESQSKENLFLKEALTPTATAILIETGGGETLGGFEEKLKNKKPEDLAYQKEANAISIDSRQTYWDSRQKEAKRWKKQWKKWEKVWTEWANEQIKKTDTDKEERLGNLRQVGIINDENEITLGEFFKRYSSNMYKFIQDLSKDSGGRQLSYDELSKKLKRPEIETLKNHFGREEEIKTLNRWYVYGT